MVDKTENKTLWARIKEYLLNILIAADQLANAILLGKPDETLSARSWRLHERYWYAEVARVIIDFIFRIFGQKAHCYNSYLSEKNNSHLPDEY